MTNPTSTSNRGTATPPRPPYELIHLISMLDRQAEAEKAREMSNQPAATRPPDWKVPP
jgi:hypothetical protein